MTIFGYARVSTEGQTLDSQLEALKAAGCEKIFREKVTGAYADRAQLARLLATIDSGAVLIVSHLDRLARSTRDLLNILDTLAARGADFRSPGDSWADTTTPHGRLMFTVRGGLAEFERELICLRWRRPRPRQGARCSYGTAAETDAAPVARGAGRSCLGTATQADLARRFHVSQSTISRLAEKVSPSLPPKATLDAETERAARSFMKRIEGKYPTSEGLVYGSRARCTHKADSDADLAVILKGKRGDRSAAVIDVAGIAVDVLQETGILVQALPLWEDELQRPELFSIPR